MNLIHALTGGALAPALLIAQAPASPAQALVARYAALLKAYPQMLKDEKAEKSRIPTADTVTGLSVLIAHETRPDVRQVLMAARFLMAECLAPEPSSLSEAAADYSGTLATAFSLEFAGQVTPDSPALELLARHSPGKLSFIAWHASGGGFVDQSEQTAADKAVAFLDRVFKENPSREVKALALATGAELFSRPRLLPQVEQYVARLEAFEPSHPGVATWKAWVAQAKAEDASAPAVGKPVPPFTLQSLDAPGTTLTPASFKGKYYLLDFWATWCGPCKGELPYVHKAFARFHPAGLEMLSISWDRKAEDIQAFRRDPAHPMPWNHAFPQGKVAQDLNAAFQVRGIPFVLLIGPDGRILEMAEALRGENLERTLGKYLKAK